MERLPIMVVSVDQGGGDAAARMVSFFLYSNAVEDIVLTSEKNLLCIENLVEIGDGSQQLTFVYRKFSFS